MFIHVLAGIAILVGVLINITMSALIFLGAKKELPLPLVPFVGGIFLFLGLLGFESTRIYAPLGLMLDVGTLGLIRALLLRAKHRWDYSERRLIHHFISKGIGRSDELKLFKSMKYSLLSKFDPPFDRPRQGALLECGTMGRWQLENDTFILNEFNKARTLKLVPEGSEYRGQETNLSEDPSEDVPYGNLLFEKKR